MAAKIRNSSTTEVNRSQIHLNPYNPKNHSDDCEEWKPICGYERYSISTQGRILNTVTQKFLKPRNRGGYMRVVLYNENHKPKSHSIHRLVANAFIPNPEHKPYIDHKNTKRDDNSVENLRWVTSVENASNPISKMKQREGLKGHIVSDECRNKISKANKGRIRSEETRRKLSIANMGKTPSNKGIPKNETTKQKLREIMIQKYRSGEIVPKNTKAVIQYDLNGNTLGIWPSITVAARENCLDKTGICLCAKGVQKTYKGKVWKYYEVSK